MKQSRFTDEQIIGFLKQADAGMSVKELCRSGGFSQPTFYKCRCLWALADRSMSKLVGIIDNQRAFLSPTNHGRQPQRHRRDKGDQ